MLGSGMLILGVPIAIGSCLHAYRDARDRSFVWAATVVCVVAVMLTAAELVIPGGVLRRLLP